MEMVTVASDQAVDKPNILNLPREIRDNIYSYLYEPCTKGPADRRHVNRNFVQVTLTLNLPCYSLLLAHSRFFEEYQEAHTFRELSAQLTLDASQGAPGIGARRMHLPPLIRSTTKATECARVCHLTVLCNYPENQNGDARSFWGHSMIQWITKYTSELPHLKTIRVMQRVLNDRLCAIDELPVLTEDRTSDPPRADFLPTMPVVFRNMDMIQRGEGLRFGQRGPLFMFEDDNTSVMHCQHKIGVYTYTKENPKSKQFLWTKKQILDADDSFPESVSYESNALDAMAKEVREFCQTAPTVLIEWKEERGEELKAR